MNEHLAMLLDGNPELWPVASAALAIVVGGLVLAWFSRRSRHQDDLEKAAQTEIKTGMDFINRRLDSESEQRRKKDDDLGDDIQDTRGALDHLCGSLGKERPSYRNKR